MTLHSVFIFTVNVAFNKPSYIQYSYPDDDDWDASNAVDGRKSNLSYDGGQCAPAVRTQTATWWVNLTTIHSIHHITIYFLMTYGELDFYTGLSNYLIGFSVYVSNTTDRLQGTLCYKDDNFTPLTIPSVFTTTCPVHGQYVIYYNERLPGVIYPRGYSAAVFSGHCEVEVYGCPGGFYGLNCSNACPDTNCYCDLVTGTCQGCKPGYQGYLCKSACGRGYYGVECQQECGHCHDLTKCFHTNGSCLTRCEAGYHGEACKASCQYGFFGPDCLHECNDTCDGCNRFNGSCDSGCNPGWQGYECQDACDTDSFGYHMDLCKTPCPSGFFGPDCVDICKDACDGCNRFNGSCDSGCNTGWHGYECQIECSPPPTPPPARWDKDRSAELVRLNPLDCFVYCAQSALNEFLTGTRFLTTQGETQDCLLREHLTETIATRARCASSITPGFHRTPEP
uniref:Multiple epidermal growth factor-like domains 10 n=1 Tax=Magallana gigas TaxID=29159 RepID=A0A8W8NTX1_MAGGI